MKKIYYLLIALFLLGSVSFAQEVKDKVKFSGLMFGDYYYNITTTNPATQDLQGFQFRRIYFTADITVSDNFDARFRLESDGSSKSNTGGGQYGVMVKDAYLKWKGIFSGSDMVFGISPTPAFDITESVWAYRSLEKTIMDLNGVVPSRDFGVDLKGKITESGSVNYWFKAGNNNANSPENDKFKRFYGLLQIKPIDNLMILAYGDFAGATDVKDANDNNTFKSNNSYVGALMVNYKMKEDFSIGAEFVTKTAQNGFLAVNGQPLTDLNSLGISVWGWVSLSDQFRLVGRFDSFDPNTNKDNDAYTLILAGIDYRAAKNVSIIPNVEVMTYQTAGANGNSSNVIGRLTFSFTF